jgi:hypothetical protein
MSSANSCPMLFGNKVTCLITNVSDFDVFETLSVFYVSNVSSYSSSRPIKINDFSLRYFMSISL